MDKKHIWHMHYRGKRKTVCGLPLHSAATTNYWDRTTCKRCKTAKKNYIKKHGNSP